MAGPAAWDAPTAVAEPASGAARGGTNDTIAKLYTEQDSSRPTVKLVRRPDAADRPEAQKVQAHDTG